MQGLTLHGSSVVLRPPEPVSDCRAGQANTIGGDPEVKQQAAEIGGSRMPVVSGPKKETRGTALSSTASSVNETAGNSRHLKS